MKPSSSLRMTEQMQILWYRLECISRDLRSTQDSLNSVFSICRRILSTKVPLHFLVHHGWLIMRELTYMYVVVTKTVTNTETKLDNTKR